MELLILPSGEVRCVYGEQMDLRSLGETAITRASHVEPDAAGRWWADLAPVKGPVLGPFTHRSEAVAAEIEWLAMHWIAASADDGDPEIVINRKEMH